MILKKQNLLFWIFFSSILLDYIHVNKIYYIFYLIAFGILFYDIWKQHLIKPRISYDNKFLSLSVLFYVYIILISILNLSSIDLKDVLKTASIAVLFVIILVKLSVCGKEYISNFYKHFVYLINAFALVNIYEILTKKSVFYIFLSSAAKYWQVYAFGTDVFRTFSIFEHPIVYAVFLLVLFWCNNFIIKNKVIKYLLQINILVNLFFTKSRSVWIALCITVFVYCLKAIISKLQNHNLKITYKKVFKLSFTLAVLIILICIFSKQVSIIFNIMSQRLITVTNDSYGDISRLQRLGTIKTINYYMLNNGIVNFLFGNGIGAVNKFMINNPVVIAGFTTTDNQYLAFFYNFGVTGIFIYILIIFLAIVKFFNTDIKNIDNLSILCFLSISVSMFFFESFGWTDVFIFLTISIAFMSLKKDKSNKGLKYK